MRWNRTGNQRILLKARSGTGGDPENEPYGFPGKPRMREMIPDKCRMNTIQAGQDNTDGNKNDITKKVFRKEITI